MGISGLFQFLRKSYPKTIVESTLKAFKDQRCATDSSTYIYKSKSIYNEKWKNYFIQFIILCKKYNITNTFIVEGRSPIEKAKEAESRKNQKDSSEEKVFTLKIAIDQYEATGEISEVLKEADEHVAKKSLESSSRSLLHLPAKNKVDISAIKAYAKKLEENILHVTREDIKELKQLFKVFGVSFIQAKGEAEAVASSLCISGKVDFVISEDSDVTAYETPVFVCKLDIFRDACEVIRYPNLLNELNFTSSQYLDFCVLCGTDYNENIPRIGPKRSEGYIRKYKSIEKMMKALPDLDYSILNRETSRKMFRKPDTQGWLFDETPLIEEKVEESKEEDKSKEEENKTEDKSNVEEKVEEVEISFSDDDDEEEKKEDTINLSWLPVDITELFEYLDQQKYYNNRDQIDKLFRSKNDDKDNGDESVSEEDKETEEEDTIKVLEN